MRGVLSNKIVKGFWQCICALHECGALCCFFKTVHLLGLNINAISVSNNLIICARQGIEKWNCSFYTYFVPNKNYTFLQSEKNKNDIILQSEKNKNDIILQSEKKQKLHHFTILKKQKITPFYNQKKQKFHLFTI